MNKVQVRIMRLPHAADLPLPAYQSAHAAGLDLVDPGVVPILRWRPDTDTEPLTDAQVALYGGVARKP